MGKRYNPTGDAASGKRHAKKVCACVGACVTCLHELANPPPANLAQTHTTQATNLTTQLGQDHPEFLDSVLGDLDELCTARSEGGITGWATSALALVQRRLYNNVNTAAGRRSRTGRAESA